MVIKGGNYHHHQVLGGEALTGEKACRFVVGGEALFSDPGELLEEAAGEGVDLLNTAAAAGDLLGITYGVNLCIPSGGKTGLGAADTLLVGEETGLATDTTDEGGGDVIAEDSRPPAPATAAAAAAEVAGRPGHKPAGTLPYRAAVLCWWWAASKACSC